jgi:hypothetical protein
VRIPIRRRRLRCARLRVRTSAFYSTRVGSGQALILSKATGGQCAAVVPSGGVASEWHFLGLVFEADWVEAWGTWVGGLGTVGALFYAVKALRSEIQHRRDDIREAKREQRAAEEAQARTVLFYDRSAEVRPGQPIRLAFKVGNLGSTPITNVKGVMTHRYTGQKIGDDRYATLPALVPNGNDSLWWDVPADVLGNEPPPSNPPSLTGVLKVEVFWTDVHGIRWELELDSGQQPKRYVRDADFPEVPDRT